MPFLSVSVDQSDDHPNSIIQLNLRALRAHIESTDYRIIETIFSNFNLFPQVNKTKQFNESDSRLLAMPISYQIANWPTIKTNEDLIRIQIRVSKVRSTHLLEIVSTDLHRPIKRAISPVFTGRSMRTTGHGSRMMGVVSLVILMIMLSAIVII
jgi:hypothetical protein